MYQNIASQRMEDLVIESFPHMENRDRNDILYRYRMLSGDILNLDEYTDYSALNQLKQQL